MFTKHQDIFLKVQARMKNNQTVGNSLNFFGTKKERLEQANHIITQTVFETLSVLEEHHPKPPMDKLQKLTREFIENTNDKIELINTISKNILETNEKIIKNLNKLFN